VKSAACRLFTLENGLHLDFWKLVIAAFSLVAGAALTAGAYYVKTQAEAAASTRFEQLARELMGKIDGLKDALNAVNVTLGRSDERHDQTARDIARLEQRMTRLETRP
jgi:phage shock protein A